MPSRTGLVVAGVIALALILGVGAYQLVEQRNSINSLRAQVGQISKLRSEVVALRGPSVPGAPLTLYGVEGDASGAEQDAQQAESDIETLQDELGTGTSPDAVTSQLTCIEGDISTLAEAIGSAPTSVTYDVCG